MKRSKQAYDDKYFEMNQNNINTQKGIKSLISLKTVAFNVAPEQGVSYSQKFCGKPSFPNLVNNRASQFLFPKYWIEYQNVNINSEIRI